MSELEEQLLGWFKKISACPCKAYPDQKCPSSVEQFCFENYQAICNLIRCGLKLAKHKDGWWIRLLGKNGKEANLCLGENHGPIVESVLRDNCEMDASGDLEIKETR